MQETATATISPDGQFAWNGTEWVPNPAYAGTPVPPPVAEKPKKKRRGLKIGAGVLGLLAILGIANAGGDDSATGAAAPQDVASASVAVEDKAAEEPAAVAEEPVVEEPAAPVETRAQENARESAESYLRSSDFSRQGLIDQLEFEDYSTADATYAVDAINPDWNEQAAKSAESYLRSSSFSRQGLIDQLEFEGFTHEQAVYGVDTTGL